MAEVRVGLVGVGGIGQVHLDRWRQLESDSAGVAVAAVCDVDRKRAEATGLPAFTDLNAMLDAVDLDLVDVCTPPKFHAPVVLTALGSGLPTLCEKPLATTPDEARSLVEAAERAGQTLMVGHCHRYHDPIVHVKGMLERGELGRPLMFRNRFATLFSGVADTWFSNRAIAGGGALMDTSVHSVDLFRFLIGEIESATVMTNTFNAKIEGLEDSAVMLLRAENGALGVIEASWQTPFSVNVVEIYGESGAAIIDYDTGTLRTRVLTDEEWQTPELPGRDRFLEELRHVLAVARGEAEPLVTGHDGLRAVEVIHAAYAAETRN